VSEVDKIELMATSVVRNLEKNGYPNRPVAFPLEKLYDSAHERGINFNKVRDALRERGIDSVLESARIVFSPLKKEDSGSFNPFDLGKMFAKVKENPDLISKARDTIANVTPEQLAQMAKMIPGLDPGMISQFAAQFASMDAEERRRVFDLAASQMNENQKDK
jgi:hypothetical protein